MRKTWLLVVSMMFAAPAAAQSAGDADKGLAYAKAHCTECHLVDRSVPPSSVTISAISFADVANTPGMTETALTVWFSTPHPNMPNIIIPTDDRRNVVAYILSLKAK